MEYRNTQLFVLPSNAIADDGLTTVATVQSGASAPGSTAVNAVTDGVVGFAIDGVHKHATNFKGMLYTFDDTNISSNDFTGMASMPKWFKVIRGFNPNDPLSNWAGPAQSGEIYFSNITSIRKVAPVATSQPMIKTVGQDGTAAADATCHESLHITCGNTYSLQLRAKSFIADSISAKGLVKSYTLQAPCCNDTHCDAKNAVEAAFYTAYKLVDMINADEMMKPFITAQVVGFYTADPAGTPALTDLTSSTTYASIQPALELAVANNKDVEGTDFAVGIKLTGVAQPNWVDPANPLNFQVRNDAVIISAYFAKGKPVGENYVWDACDYAKVTLKQDILFPRLTGAEMVLEEIKYSDSHNIFTETFYNTAYNTAKLPSYVDKTQYYTWYVIDYVPKEDKSYNFQIDQTRRVIIAVPAGTDGATTPATKIGTIMAMISAKSGVPIVNE